MIFLLDEKSAFVKVIDAPCLSWMVYFSQRNIFYRKTILASILKSNPTWFSTSEKFFKRIFMKSFKRRVHTIEKRNKKKKGSFEAQMHA